ncbi:hypothetical protein IFM89_023818 [Coptis chinensis]|uniref:Uncharacterized protein n=1 Tax=Coptis chinensis TaxID=261450 RepID=A0A835HF75_9MAGN|nr:hypothetical protein IFM89_023818 [Coptis chinensis]
MKDLKASVRNHARPRGAWPECNLAEESVTFFSEHMKRVDINNDQPSRNEDYNDESTKSNILEGKPLLKGTIITLTRDMVEAAHRCILFNFEEVQPYIERHKKMLIRKEPRLGRNEGALGAKHAETFNEWFKLEVKKQVKVSIGKESKDTFIVLMPKIETAYQFQGSDSTQLWKEDRFHTTLLEPIIALGAGLLGTIPNITSLINKTIDELESEMDHLGVPIALDAGGSSSRGFKHGGYMSSKKTMEINPKILSWKAEEEGRSLIRMTSRLKIWLHCCLKLPFSYGFILMTPILFGNRIHRMLKLGPSIDEDSLTILKSTIDMPPLEDVDAEGSKMEEVD